MNIIKFTKKPSLNTADEILQASIGEYESVVMLGETVEGNYFYRASQNLPCKDVLWMLEKFKLAILQQESEEE